MADHKKNEKEEEPQLQLVHENRRYKCQKVAKLTNNGYLNWLRQFKMMYCGIYSPRNMVHFGAIAWWTLSEDQKMEFKAMAIVERSRLSAQRALQKIKKAKAAKRRFIAAKNGKKLVGIRRSSKNRNRISPKCVVRLVVPQKYAAALAAYRSALPAFPQIEAAAPAESQPAPKEHTWQGFSLDFEMLAKFFNQAYNRMGPNTSSVEIKEVANASVEANARKEAVASEEAPAANPHMEDIDRVRGESCFEIDPYFIMACNPCSQSKLNLVPSDYASHSSQPSQCRIPDDALEEPCSNLKLYDLH